VLHRDAEATNELYKANCASVTPYNTCRGNNQNLEHIPTSHSLEKSASLRVEGEFLLLYNKAKTCDKQKKKTHFYMPDDINDEKS
jgi:hypothetical protein